MTEVDANTVVVFDRTEFATAVGAGNTYYYVFLGADIELTGGVTIDPNKPSLVIDGRYQGVTRTLTDRVSTLATDTFGIGSASDIKLTLQNLIIHGRNYYGLPYVYELAATSDLEITYQNVTYTGPQLTYNLNGLTRYIDCDITIVETSGIEAQEVGEVNRVEIGGVTTIRHNSTRADRGTFWFEGSASTAALTILAGAQVEIRSANNYFMYSQGVLGGQIPPRYVIQNGASFTLYANRGISYTNGHRITSFTVEPNASFYYVQNVANGTNASLYIDGALTVQEGASFYMQANFDGAQPLINFRTTSASLALNNPKSFVVYNRSAAALSFAAPPAINFSLTGNQVNYWETAATLPGAGGFPDIPLHKWNKPEWTTFTIGGTVSSSGTTVTSNPFVGTDNVPAITLLRLQTAHVLSVGNLRIMLPSVIDDGSPITGWTEPGAQVHIQYTVDSVNYAFDGVAGADGFFSIPKLDTDPPVPVDTDVTISVNTPFLITTIGTKSVAAGELYIDTAPAVIAYRPRALPGAPVLLPRVIPDDPVVVMDHRADKTSWRLFASVTGPLETAEGDVLIDAVVFKSGVDAASIVTLGAMPILVHTDNGGAQETDVFWDDDKGILVRLNEAIRNGIVYTTNVIWNLEAT